MSLTRPKVSTSKPFSDNFSEGERFYLQGIRVVTANSIEFGKGEMVLLKVDGHNEELGIWGQYLLEQAKSVEDSDLNKWYVIKRDIVESYSKRPVKLIAPAEVPGQGDDDHPF